MQGGLARLVTTQNEDGGWSWSLPNLDASHKQGKERGTSDLKVSADAVSALALAKQLGFTVPGKTLTAALDYLKAQFQASGEADNDNKAIIAYAQSLAGSGDFGSLNRLYRLRNGLSARSLALLVLSLHDAEHEPMAREVSQLLLDRIPRAALKSGTRVANRRRAA